MLAALIAWSATILVQERVVTGAEERLDRQTAAIAGDKPVIPPPPEPLAASAPPRALLADALLRARAAQPLGEGAERRSLIDQAADELTAAAGARPYWGERQATVAFVQTLRDGDDSTPALQSLGRSYDVTPYLVHAAPWRVAFGVRHWNMVAAATRDHIVDEAVWISRVDPKTLDGIFGLFRGTAAYEPFLRRWLTARRGDADFRSSRR
jgi:hypothetical protein